MLRQEAIRLEAERMDALQEGIWDKAVNGDARAVEVCLKVLERRSRMFGLDFQDMISSKQVEIEQARVQVMATALTQAFSVVSLSEDDRHRITAAFFSELRASEQANNQQTALPA